MDEGGARTPPSLTRAQYFQLAPAVWNSAASTPANATSLSFNADLPSLKKVSLGPALRPPLRSRSRYVAVVRFLRIFPSADPIGYGLDPDGGFEAHAKGC